MDISDDLIETTLFMIIENIVTTFELKVEQLKSALKDVSWEGYLGIKLW